MISSRPSLRKIIAPPGFDLNDKKETSFLVSRMPCLLVVSNCFAEV
jgi:hypothetical protein